MLREDALTSGYLWNTAVRQEAIEQLRHRDRLALVGQVASGIAHEVGTPLNVIAGRARLSTEPDTTQEEARLHAHVVLDQSERVAITIRQLLDFARRRGPQRARANLHDVARRVLDLLRPLAAKRQIDLELLPWSVLPIAAVDATQIEQALSNLIMNAVPATQEHGVVKVRADVVAAATREIVRDQGGWIEVESQPWRGSRFTIYLPKSTPLGHQVLQRRRSLAGRAAPDLLMSAAVRLSIFATVGQNTPTSRA